MKLLLPQQVAAYEYAMPKARIALFMEMRLGKTLSALRWAEDSGLNKTLIVCPKAVSDTWIEALEDDKWGIQDICVLDGNKDDRLDMAELEAKWFVIGYEALLKTKGLFDINWDGIILDESTRIRNPQADITKCLLRNSGKFRHRAVLSGLPAPESPLDYYCQMAFVWDSFMSSYDYWQFRAKHFYPGGFGGHDWKCTKTMEDRIKDQVGDLAFVMTRKEAGLGSEKLYEARKVPMGLEQKKLNRQIDEGFEWSIDGIGQETKWVPVQYMWYGMVAGGFSPVGEPISEAKTAELMSLLKGELSGDQVVVWCKHTWEIKHLSKRLKERGITHAIFTSDHQDGEREFKLGKAQVMVAQPKCAQYGLDWSIASTAIYYSNWYDGEVRAQTEDRIVHPLKNEPLLYIDLVTEGSIDEDVIDILKEKRLNAQQFMEELARRRSRRVL